MVDDTIQPIPTKESPQYNPISIGEWLITAIIFTIPIVGFIMLFVWGFGNNTHPSKANWAKATLIIIGISILLSVLFFGTILGILGSIIS